MSLSTVLRYGILSQGGIIAPSFPVSGLTSYYRMDETSGTAVADVLGTNNGTAAYNTWVAGKNNNAIRLNSGSFPYVRMAKRSLDYNQPWSMSMWIKREAISFYFCWLYVASKQASPYSGWRLGFDNTDKFHCQIQNDGTYQIFQQGNLTLTDTSAFHHVVFTYNGNGLASGCKYYIDNVEGTWTVTTDNLQSHAITNAGTYDYIGQIDNLIAYNPQAIFDEYGIWNRVLTPEEVSTLYNGGNGKFYSLPEISSPAEISNLIAWYGDTVNSGVDRTTLSDGAALTQWDDLSGNAYHLDTVVDSPIYNATKNALDFNSGVLWNATHDVLGSSTAARTVFLVSETATMNTVQDFLWIGKLVQPYFYGIGVGGVNDTFTAAESGYRRWNRNSNTADIPHLFTTYQSGSTIQTYSYAKQNGNALSVNTTNNGNVGGGAGIVGGGGYINPDGVSVTRRGDVINYEIIVYNRILTAVEITQVETWLNTKYTIY